MHAMLRPLVLAVTATLLTAGCSLAPNYKRPVAPIPSEWSAPEDVESLAGEADQEGIGWESFVIDPALEQIVRVALGNNRDLRQAFIRVEAARASYRVRRADRLPSLDAQLSSTRGRGVSAPVSSPYEITETWTAGANLAAFELDLFGRLRNLSEAGLQEFLATEQASRTAEVSLVSEVVNVYVSRLGAIESRAVLARTLEAREKSAQLVISRRQAGAASGLEEQDAQILLHQARADIERVDRQISQATNALRVLIGVSDIDPYLTAPAALRNLTKLRLPAGTPSEVIVSRPDILAAEHRLRARHADIGVARAAFFPQLSLTAMFGTASAEFSSLFEGGARAWSFSPQMTLPIFSGGRNTANLRVTEAGRDLAIAEYEGAIQTAFREVSDALVATTTLDREVEARREIAAASGKSLQLAESRWRAGVDGSLRYLDAQRLDLSSQLSLIDADVQRQIAVTDLFRAIGGYWPAAVREVASQSANGDVERQQ